MSADSGSGPTARAGRLVPDVVRRRFARKFVAVVVLAMLVMAGVGGYQYLSATERVEAQVDDRLTATAELQADSTDEWLAGLSQYTATVSEDRDFQRSSTREIQVYLFELESRMPASAEEMHYVDLLSGEIEASTNSEAVGVNVTKANVSWGDDLERVGTVTDIASNTYLASEPYRAVGENESVVAFVSSPAKNTQHGVVVTASLADRERTGYETANGTYTTVLDADGGPIMQTRERNATLPGEHVGANDSGVVAAGDEMLGYAPVAAADWTVVTHTPKAQAFAMRNQIGFSMLTMLLTGLLVLGAVAVGVGRRVGGTLDTLTSKAEAMEAGELDVTLRSGRVDEFGRLFAAFDSMREALREQIADAETARERAESAKARAEQARAEAEQAQREAVELNEQLEATAAEFGDVMADCAEGDLSCRMPTDADSDAMADIATAYNEMMDEWEETIRRVREFGDSVERASTDVAERVDRAEATSENIAESMGTIATDAVDQADDLQDVGAEMQDLSASVEEASASANEVANLATEVLDSGEAGREAAVAAMDELDDIERRTEAAAAQLAELESLVDDIEAVVDVIADIADQTNMLALNASIEAAHADSDGDGFAVVADEVKTLVEETRDATGDIEATIEEVKDQTERTVTEMDAAREAVAAGSDTIEEALGAFESIVDDIEETVDGVREIDRATADQADSTQAVMTSLESVTEVSMETATEAERAAGEARTQAEGMSAVSEGIDELATRAERLRDLLAAFETEGDREAVAAGDEPTPKLTGGETDAAAQPSALPGGTATTATDGGGDDGRD